MSKATQRSGAVAAAARLDEIRGFFARLMAATAESDDPRFERAFASVKREAFLSPGPWQIQVTRDKYVATPSDDPAYLCQNVVVAHDPTRRINNGEPFLHARWIGAVAPQPGETVCQIGAGTGYYTAMLAALVAPGGTVTAFEIDDVLADTARRNLAPFKNAAVVSGDATRLPLPRSDVIYVNAGVVAPPAAWLQALNPQGRIILPWRPADDIALTLLIRRVAAGFTVQPIGQSWFIPCVGASDLAICRRPPSHSEAAAARSLWLVRERAPDADAVAIYDEVWFSATELAADFS
ncbi:protein-L-isoaspartate(D-aspartate) O-methyltransferase [Rhodopseudomonas rhenobacensis]|uniref:Protein-L-isoaspartate O-methyltransferase n=1 Tax=Rhodopseudomonas rhenobacensis TaxID=87461 RepID=A0A7W7Z4K2_9BRAD|nr:methyltransferase domain-containing protein [Rhodopseudomonas rhenobacensis]MBB5047902.1 protein-L-isoaspartate(D-aspartate) O-methyltransferase [Rhodopseudomonas rhenobacensis]